ncbi:hypothetical protein KSP40_PGU005721 [Platanthera guangdongensis]|uniref:diphosphoinositol-pentakisphosphate 1-kinase n=1 Tax=Platanthera guangdongensis TaxID=2320717 RepID=A0ABR2MHL0_9ASPA
MFSQQLPPHASFSVDAPSSSHIEIATPREVLRELRELVTRKPDSDTMYYDDAACVLRKLFFDAKAPHLSSTIPPILPWKVNEPAQSSEGLTRQGSGIIGTSGQSDELRCVIAVIRHGDRTPKQKVKLKVTEEKLLNLMLKYNGGRPRAEVILCPQNHLEILEQSLS